jgi:hypothetical protein
MEGFIKVFERTTHQIKKSFGAKDQIKDPEYEKNFTEFCNQEKSCVNFQKHVKQLVESIHALSSNIKFIAEDCNGK